MSKTRMLGHLAAAVLVAVVFQSVLAEAPTPRRGATVKAAAHAVPAAKSKTPITFSITSSLRGGNLVVSLDNVPVFNENFQKPMLLISQTTTWDPVPISPGKHRLTAKVIGQNGTTYLSAAYDLDVSRTKGIELRFRTKRSGLTVEPAS